ncbi:MAG: DUF3472 domain-containing protein [Dysgonamonadaceae bacterium]|jgi:hypothetical protein|nr:DUF3472 domain-containing protein [Dysgonamonadaceae bacterium]
MKKIALIFIVIFSLINTYSLTAQSDALPADTKKIPLGGNSYLKVRGASERVTDKGFQAWTNAESIFSTYFRVNGEGDLRLYLEYGTDADGNGIEVACKGKTFSLALPAPRTGKDTVVYIGTIENCGAGYVEVDFRGKTRQGKTFATPSALLVGGRAAESMNYVGDFSYYWGRRGPSVHISYRIPSEITAEWFYNEVTVLKGFDPTGSYFMANGFSGGYFGMQVNSATERRILFSVWSPYETDNPDQIPEEYRVKLVRKGEGVTINDFGNEGSGGQSFLVYNWKAGNTYRFLNRIRPVENGYTEYTAYFFAPETGRWRLIAQWRRPKTQSYYKGAHSFLENFDNNMGHVTRKAYYRNQWVYTTDGQWVELLDGKFTVDATGRPGWRMDYKGGLEGKGFFLQNCGFFNDYVPADTEFRRASSGKPPKVNLKKIEGIEK